MSTNGNSRITAVRSPLASGGLGNALWEFAKRSSYVVARFLKRHFFPIFAAAVIVSIAFLLYAELRRRTSKEIVLYTGPWGGVYRQQGQLIASELDKQSMGRLARTYRLTPRPSDGFEENQRRLVQEGGKAMGFVTDGLGGVEQRQKLGVLVPLEDNVLHIFCPTKFLKEVMPEEGDSAILTLQTLAPHLRQERGRVYLGPPGSGTRQTAELVLAQHGLGHLSESTHGVANFEEMRAALWTGHIVLGFYCGPQGAAIVEKIAADGSCRLVGLNDSHLGTIATTKGLSKHTIHKHTYRTGSLCPHDLITVRTRTVLACPLTLPDTDAYAVLIAATKALSGNTRTRWREGAYQEWNGQPIEDQTVLALHPAAELFLRGGQPSSLMTWTTYFLSMFGAWMLAEFLRWATAKIPDRGNGPPNGNGVPSPAAVAIAPSNGQPEASRYEMFNQQIEQRVHDLAAVLSTASDARTKCNQWLRETAEIQASIDSDWQQGLLSTEKYNRLSDLVDELRERVARFRDRLDRLRSRSAGEAAGSRF